MYELEIVWENIHRNVSNGFFVSLFFWVEGLTKDFDFFFFVAFCNFLICLQ